MDMYRMMIQIS